MLKQLILTLIGALSTLAILSAEETAKAAGDWEASWIGVADAPSENQWICYRKVVELEEAPSHAFAKIAADSKYWLWINGELVVFEGQLKRGTTPQNTYYDQIDLAEFLDEGDNTIAILLWYFGKQSFSHKSSGQSGLVFDATVNGKRLLSDASWKAITHPSFGHTGEPHPNYRLPESKIRFDATKEPRGWQRAEFDDSSWPMATEFGRPPCAPWNQLVRRPIPIWKDFGLKDYINADTLPEVSDGSTIKATLPYNAQVTLPKSRSSGRSDDRPTYG